MNYAVRISELREKRQRLLRSAEELGQKNSKSAVDRARMTDQLNQAQEISEEIRRLTDLQAAIASVATEQQQDAARLQQLDSHLSDLGYRKHTMTPAEVREEFRLFMRGQERRTSMGVSAGNAGGYLAPAAFYTTLISSLKQLDPLFNRDIVTLIETERATPLSIPMLDDVEESASIVSESQQNTENEPANIAHAVLNGYSYRSSKCYVTLELEQDSFESIASILSNAFAVRLARGIGADLVNGNGTTAPQGILSAAAAGPTATGDAVAGTSGGTSVGFDDLNALYFSIDAAYRNRPGFRFLMNDSTLQKIKGLKDSSKRPLKLIRENAKGELTLFEKPISICPSMPSLGVNNRPIVAGDVSQFAVRVAKNSVKVQRYFDAPGLVENGVAAYSAFLRVDAKLLAPGSAQPVKYLQNASS